MVSLPPGVAAALEERGQAVEQLGARPEPEAGVELVRLLGETSWYLREKAVAALVRRPESPACILQTLKHGAWYARASACDALGLRREKVALPGILAAVEDRNVSLQKSAVRAVTRLAQEHGAALVADFVAGLPGERRRRIVARVEHQAPHFARELDRALDEVPREKWSRSSGIRRPAPSAAVSRGIETRTLFQFRRWLRADLHSGVV